MEYVGYTFLLDFQPQSKKKKENKKELIRGETIPSNALCIERASLHYLPSFSGPDSFSCLSFPCRKDLADVNNSAANGSGGVGRLPPLPRWAGTICLQHPATRMLQRLLWLVLSRISLQILAHSDCVYPATLCCIQHLCFAQCSSVHCKNALSDAWVPGEQGFIKPKRGEGAL